MLLTFHDIRAQYAPAFALLRFQWDQQATGLPRFRPSMNAIAQLVEQNTVAEILIDLHGLPSLGLDEQLWLAASWLKRVSVPAVRQVALVLPSSDGVYNQMVVESLLRVSQHFMHYDIQFFNEPAGALDWLLGHNPAAQAALEREWATPVTAPDYPAR